MLSELSSANASPPVPPGGYDWENSETLFEEKMKEFRDFCRADTMLWEFHFERLR